MSNIFDIGLAQRHPFATSMLTSAINSQRLSHAYLLSGRGPDDKSSGSAADDKSSARAADDKSSARTSDDKSSARTSDDKSSRKAPVDKWLFARQVAAYLNCSNLAANNDRACQLIGLPEKEQCVNCKWINAEKHPQAWLTLSSEGRKSGKIAVEKARLLSDELSKHSEFFRVVVIEDASQEAFHRPSANALLKTIEDPGSRCIFFLFASREDDVLPTVVSRCQVIPMQSPPERPTALAAAILKTGPADLAPTNPELKPFTDAVKQIFKSRDSHLNLYALDLSRQIQIAIEEIEDPVVVLDLATNLEICRIGERASLDSAAAGYLADLLSLAEEVKLQLDHYVSSKAAIETFVLSWWRLRRAAGC